MIEAPLEETSQTHTIVVDGLIGQFCPPMIFDQFGKRQVFQFGVDIASGRNLHQHVITECQQITMSDGFDIGTGAHVLQKQIQRVFDVFPGLDAPGGMGCRQIVLNQFAYEVFLVRLGKFLHSGIIAIDYFIINGFIVLREILSPGNALILHSMDEEVRLQQFLSEQIDIPLVVRDRFKHIPGVDQGCSGARIITLDQTCPNN